MRLRTQIVALVVALTAAILAGLWLLLSGSWSGWSSETVERDLRDRAGAIARTVEVEHGALDIEDEEDARALRDAAHPYRIVATGGEVFRASGELPWPAPSPGRVGDVRDAAGRPWRVVTEAFDVGHGREGSARILVQVAGESAPYAGLEQRFRRGLLLALAAALVLGGFGAALLAHLSLAPLRRLASDVDAIGATSLDRRVTTAGLDPELGRVASAFNALLGRLEAAMEHQRRLVSRASHALRTPTATILTRAEVALRRQRSPEEYRSALEDVAAAARESSALVAHLLTLSRLDERRGAVSREPVPVSALVGDVARMLAPRAQGAGVLIAIEVDERLVVDVERASFRELLEALLDNALRYTPRGGSVGVRATASGRDGTVAVWDTGPGIPAAERDRVFERFYRGAGGQASGQPGSGLGLAIVKAIADAHGARVALAEPPGGGLEVAVTFPEAVLQG